MGNKSKPKVTIITVTYNSEKTLARAIGSIAAQDYDNLEYLIVDGGSTDATLDIVKSHNDVVTKWVSEPDEGIADAFNKGILMASGDVIGLINSDDGLMEGAVDGLAAVYDPEIDVYRARCLFVNEETGARSIETPSMRISLNGRTKVTHPSTFIARKSYERYGLYDVSLRYTMDLDLLYRYYAKGARFEFVDEVAAFFTMGGVTFSSAKAERMAEMRRVMRKNGASEKQWYAYRATQYAKDAIVGLFGRDFVLAARNRLFPSSMRAERRKG